MSELVLEIKDLKVSFPTPDGPVQAVRGVDLDVKRGELVAIVGESGSGKSVTFLGLMGLLPKSAVVSGSAKVTGEEMIGIDKKAQSRMRGKKIAMIFQDPLSALNPVLRVGPQIVEMIQSHQDLNNKQSMEKAVELLNLVGIPQPRDRAHQYPHEFSGGMRQRVMIAMAIANDPDVLIADEPTTALDVTVQAQILEVIQRIQQELNAGVVFITHDLGVVARIADRAQVMYAGLSVERATVDELFAHPSHPYTQGLMASIPKKGDTRLHPIQGAPPNMLRPPPGCAFKARCEFSIDACAQSLNTLVRIGQSESACIRAAELVEIHS